MEKSEFRTDAVKHINANTQNMWALFPAWHTLEDTWNFSIRFELT